MDKLRIGFIGTGFTRLIQIPAFQMFPDEVEVVSVASGSLENAEKTARQFNIPHFTADWRETVARDDIDLISIVTPPYLHAEMTLAALEAGKHVLCEKPTAMNAAEALAMMEKAREKKLLALIDHELRFLNGRRKAFDMIRNGDLGTINHMKMWFRNASRGLDTVKWNWWADIEKGGGALGAIGSHGVDTLRWFSSAEISEVFCLLATNFKERFDESTGTKRPVTSDDEANLILKLADGEFTRDASAIMSVSVTESGKYGHRAEIYGDKGGLMIEDGGELKFAKITDNDWQDIEVELGDVPPGSKVGGWSHGFLNFAREIKDALREGRTEIPQAATFEDGYRNQAVLDAARESDKKGCFVKVKF
jgi:predicted dehydrogenase